MWVWGLSKESVKIKAGRIFFPWERKLFFTYLQSPAYPAWTCSPHSSSRRPSTVSFCSLTLQTRGAAAPAWASSALPLFEEIKHVYLKHLRQDKENYSPDHKPLLTMKEKWSVKGWVNFTDMSHKWFSLVIFNL